MPLDENAARQESDEQIRERVESSKRTSLAKIRIQKEQDDELPAGFMVQPPTPVVGTSPQAAFQKQEDSAFTPPYEGTEAPPPTAPSSTPDQLFSPPNDDVDDDRPPMFEPSKNDDEEEDDRPPTFAPPRGDDGEVPMLDHATSAAPADEGVATESAFPRKPSAERKPAALSVGGPRGPRVGGPRGARGVTPSSGSAHTSGA